MSRGRIPRSWSMTASDIPKAIATPTSWSRASMALTGLSLMVLLLQLISVSEAKPGRVSCYVCHWNSANSNRSNFVDTCSPYNFRAETAMVVECLHGCEAVGLKNSAGEKPYHFYRNCFDSLKGVGNIPDNDRCLTVKTKAHWEDRCECLSNYCNAAPRQATNQMFVIFLTMIVTSSFALLLR